MRCSEIIDKPIFNTIEKDSFSTVYDVILNRSSNRILGFTWKKKILKKQYGIILLDDLLLISRDGLYMKNDKISREFDYNNRSKFGLSYIHDILNKIVLNIDNEVIGIVRDIILDINRGRYISLEFSEGYIDDIISGRKLITAGLGYKIDSEALILYDSNVIQPQGRGLLNMNKLT
ncbi:PRC-barrel domain-containing protein [Lutispora sp.]|uniref:PRC-barrel domain-containing protein n=1 Tax=Lutispora sp. TaxID=2828727 RepID=UPI0035691F23